MKIKLNQGYEVEKNGVRVVLLNSPQVQAQLKKRETIKKAIGYSILAALIITFLINILFLPATGAYSRVDGIYTDTLGNRYITNFISDSDKLPMVSAHRAGGELYPEETWMAFEHCLSTGDVDILEFDLHLSKDGELILLHDHELDRTSNSEQLFNKKGLKVKDLNYPELLRLNMGYNFQDANGEYIYRNISDEQINTLGIRILSLDDLFEKIQEFMADSNRNKTGKTFDDLYFIIEIKDGGSRGKDAMNKLYSKMDALGIKDRVVLGTFKQVITDFIDKQVDEGNYINTHRSAGILDVLNFYYSFLYGTEPKCNFDVMELPEKLVDGFYDLSTKEFMNYAHKYGIALQYWTINDEATMKRLLQNGADAIITDNPDLAHDVIQEMRETYNK